jgi:hypothetical protein
VQANLEGSTPRELFEAALSESEDAFEAARAALLAAAAAKGLSPATAGERGEGARPLFDAAADEAGGASVSAPPAVRALVWSELVAGGRDAFSAARRRQQQKGGESGERVELLQGQRGQQQGEGKKKRGRRGGEDDERVDEDDGGDGGDTKKHRRARRRSADEEEEEGQL